MHFHSLYLCRFQNGSLIWSAPNYHQPWVFSGLWSLANLMREMSRLVLVRFPSWCFDLYLFLHRLFDHLHFSVLWPLNSYTLILFLGFLGTRGFEPMSIRYGWVFSRPVLCLLTFLMVLFPYKNDCPLMQSILLLNLWLLSFLWRPSLPRRFWNIVIV